MPWLVGGGRWRRRQARVPHRRRVARTIKPIGLLDLERLFQPKKRPMRVLAHPKALKPPIRRMPSLFLAPHQAPRRSMRMMPYPRRITIAPRRRPSLYTLQNPMLYRNFMRSLKATVHPEAWEKIDWSAQTDITLEPGEAKALLQRRYPLAFIGTQPSPREIRQAMVKHRVEEQEFERMLREAREAGQIYD